MYMYNDDTTNHEQTVFISDLTSTKLYWASFKSFSIVNHLATLLNMYKSHHSITDFPWSLNKYYKINIYPMEKTPIKGNIIKIK
jgi:hypothetical protein